jgi:acyl dehydratase
MPYNSLKVEEIKKLVGRDLGVSDWITIDQSKIDAHAKTTGDSDWLHNDPVRAAKESPFNGKTIAQGFLILSHLSQFSEKLMPIPHNTAYPLNYGLNRVRFIKPVIEGQRIRCRTVLKDVVEKTNGHLFITENTIEIENSDRPAAIAELLGMAIKS